MNKAVWAILFSVGVACSCSGTETQNPANTLKSFQDSGCKKEKAASASSDTASASQALVSTDYGSETAGLKCFAWEVTSSGSLKIDLINFEGACGAEWSGDAALAADGTLRLSLVNPECRIAACGSCIYDWSFDVGGAVTNEALAVSVGIDTCPGEQAVQQTNAILPLDRDSSGILCNYGNFSALGWQAMALSQCGTVGMPCSGTSMCSSGGTSTEPSCTGSLFCGDNGNSAERICLTPCSSDADCSTLGVLSCQDGYCRPKNNW